MKRIALRTCATNEMTMNKMIRSIVATVLLAATAPTLAQEHVPSRVDIAWNRYYDYDEMTVLLRQLEQAYPELLTLQSLGQSVQGREMWLMTLNNPETGPDLVKPAMYIDGNIHGNEVQATEVVLYSIWYLTKMYGTNEKITDLIDRCAFYFVPSVNPDGRAHWFREPNTPHSQRSGQRPTDNDFDGELDEDGPEDLDGDGHITRMWRFDPNGRFRRNAKDPRIIERVGPDEKGELSHAGSEGIDNDGDGRINEDGPGGYDMNRNWPGGWQPNYLQFGAGDHPFSFPETACIGAFILDHPNVAAVQSYHNSGGMLLRGPGAQFRESLYPRGDQFVYDQLGEAGEEMLPYYDYMIIYADLYTVHGGTVNWTAEQLGIISFTNELWTNDWIMKGVGDGRMDDEAEMRWIDRVLFGQTFTEYSEYDHPTLGKVLIGGGNKYSSRNTPTFMLEEECHRNFAFTMFHADQMPVLSIPWIEVMQLGDQLWQVTVEILNDRIIPTRTEIAAQHGIGLPDRLTVEGDGIEIATSGTLSDRFDTTLSPTEHRPQRMLVERGIGSRDRSSFRFVIAGPKNAEITLRYEAEKARDIETTIRLTEQVIVPDE